MKKGLALFFAATMIAGLLAGCSPQSSQNGQNGSANDICIYALRTDLTDFDPHKARDLTTKSILLTNVYDPLVRLNRDGELLPALAEDWRVSSDGLEYTFDIRQDVKFHNGDILTLDDILFTYEKAKDEPTVSRYVAPIENIEKTSDTQIKMTLLEPYAPFVRTLSLIAILNESVYESTGGNYGDNPIGTGAYMIEDYITGSKTVLKRHDDYWNGAGHIETFEVRVINDPTTRALSVASGDVDMAALLDPVDLVEVRSNPDLGIVEGPGLMLVYLGMNENLEPLKDVKVRQAIARALNKDDIILAGYEGTAVEAKLPITSYSFGHTDEIVWPAFDLADAKSLMAESGFPDGFSIKLSTQAGSAAQMCEIIEANLKEIGISVEIVTLEFGTLLSECASGNYELMIMGHSDAVGDCDYALASIFSSENHGAAGNMTYYTNTEVDDYLARAKVSGDPGERLELYNKVLEIVADECPIVPLVFEPYNVVFTSTLKGVEFHPLLHLPFKEFTFE